MIQNQFIFQIASKVAALFLLFSLISPASSQSLLAREKVLEDAKTTERLLKKYHPNLYAHRTAKQIRSIWNKAKSQLPDNPGFVDAATLIQQILAAVCDGHTAGSLNDTWFDGKGRMSRLFPSGLVVLGDRLYLDDVRFGQRSREIVSINKRNNVEIIKFLKSVKSVDGCQKSKVLYSHHLLGQFNVHILLTNFLGRGPRFNVKFRNSDSGATTTSSLPTVSFRTHGRRSYYRSLRGRAFHLRSIGIPTGESEIEAAVDSDSKILVRSNAEKTLFYIFLASFDGGKAQAEVIDKELRALIKAKPEHVIVDLMDNPGGYIPNAQRFLSYFLRTSSRTGVTMRSRINRPMSEPDYSWINKERRKGSSKTITQFKKVRMRGGRYQLNIRSMSFGNKSYRGKLTVLVSPKTLSAATFTATILKRKAGAKIVGDIGDVSMKTDCNSSAGVHPLPYSRVKIAIPLICTDRHPDARRKGNLKKPDVPVDITAHNSRNINAAILKTAIKALDLKKAADPDDAPKLTGIAAKPLSEQARDFVITKRSIPVILSELPHKNGEPWLGVELENIGALKTGAPELDNRRLVLVAKVFDGSPAEKSGVKAGNILYSVNGEHILDTGSLIESIPVYRNYRRLSVRILKLADTTKDLISILNGWLSDPEDRKVAAFILGRLYLSGDFGLKNKKDSIRLLKLASDAGSSYAAAFLGTYYSGNRSNIPFASGQRPAERNPDQSMKYYTRAAALFDTATMFRLARIYDNSKGFNAASHRSDHKRVNANSELAARYLLHYFQRRRQGARNDPFKTPNLWSEDARVAMQKLLHSVGVYNGTLDGEIDQSTRRAIARLRIDNAKLPELPQEFRR